MRITRKTGFEEILGSIGTRARRTDFFAEFLSSSTEPIDRTYERYYSYVVCIARTRGTKKRTGGSDRFGAINQKEKTHPFLNQVVAV